MADDGMKFEVQIPNYDEPTQEEPKQSLSD